MTSTDLLLETLANPAFPGVAMVVIAFVSAVAYLAWDSLANRPRQFKGFRPRKTSRR